MWLSAVVELRSRQHATWFTFAGPWVTRHAGSLYPGLPDPAAGGLEQRPADFDDQIKALQDGEKAPSEQKRTQHAPVVRAHQLGSRVLERLASVRLAPTACVCGAPEAATHRIRRGSALCHRNTNRCAGGQRNGARKSVPEPLNVRATAGAGSSPSRRAGRAAEPDQHARSGQGVSRVHPSFHRSPRPRPEWRPGPAAAR